MTDRGYKAMTGFAERHHKSGLCVLAFPCNQFGKQEPGSEAEIKEFVKSKYGLPEGFQLFSKIDVNGPGTHPVFKHLKERFPGDISWNFMGNFLVGKDGTVLKRFGKMTYYDSMEAEIKKALEEKL
mmetsp:Transcript_17868/g.43721  ORF Transcript_17868/g.43721 Transcript_17868/m.43721 type:complete len:126 (-) Transcript_17868:297-674(-)|eukprot:CAMPEP_0114520416 /NCGR_PEP_ID=MMETSP0109-20121206/19564_1 /TAXON_ID=29199 /ORGANISM="Chlorarachnion reptans, Strain CCCM449" /LENGTH=125 /DNA_ID=CAMNT_0001701299 /DNA_START=324 /DNA_END=701 /DNA_ORIENTATION=+